MVLLITNNDDYSVKEVQEWLTYYGIDFIRFNYETDVIDICHVDISENIFSLIINNNIIVDSRKIDSIWYRGGSVSVHNFITKCNIAQKSFKVSLNNYLAAYSLSKRELIVEHLSNIKLLGFNDFGRCNKANMLVFAHNCNIRIPKTIITTKKNEVIAFQKKHKLIITKSLDINFDFADIDNNLWHHTYTNILPDLEKQEDFPDTFPPSIFQEYINKKYEVRVFYINGELYSAAIISQNNDNTQIDYRRYNHSNMNRVLPYKLPNEISRKIIRFMNMAKLNTGSIDLIKTDHDYVFLEINPIGQYGYVFFNCNYYIDKVISEFLINN